MKILITLGFVLVSIISYSQNPNKIRIEKMRSLNVMLGNWDVNTKMLPAPGKVVPETGTMTCASLYDSTYIECTVALTNGRAKRGYKLFITYEPDSSRYSHLYLYSNMPAKITETAKFVNGELHAQTSFVNYKGEVEKLSAIMKINGKNDLHYESRSSSTNNEVDYIADYKRRN